MPFTGSLSSEPIDTALCTIFGLKLEIGRAFRHNGS
jgi:hypothetical protein